MPAKLTTHVLDTAHGCPGRDMKIELWLLRDGIRKLLKTVRTNEDGRTTEPLLVGDEFGANEYELVFFVGDYFAARVPTSTSLPFLNCVPVRFGISDPSASYHVPLLCSPWSYSTYRGS
jgi:5-hydroxyisourate hydrolase